MTVRALIAPIVGAAVGLAIGYVDTRPGWNDTGITAGAVLVAAFVLGAARPRAFWITGLAIGTPVLALNAILHANYGAALAVLVALVGAGAGAVLGKLIGFGAADRAGV